MSIDREFIIEHFGYDPDSEKSILRRAKLLVGKSIKDIIDETPLKYTQPKYKNKGNIGNIIEEHWFGIKNNNTPEPDFTTARIELKVIPLKETAKKISMSSGKLSNGKKIKKNLTSLTVKERTKVCSIDYFKLVEEVWETSHALKKLRKVLFIYYFYNKSNLLHSEIKAFDLFVLQGTDAIIIKDDWKKTQQKVLDGLAHKLTESVKQDGGHILAASRSGSGGKDKYGKKKDLVSQPFSETQALKRAFSLKSSFTTQRWKQISTNAKYESIIESLGITDLDHFEKAILEKINTYSSWSLGQLAEEFQIPVPKGKNAGATIIKKTIGFKSVFSNIKEFEQLGILVKTFPVSPLSHLPQECVTFPYTKFAEFVNEKWDESELYQNLSKILFIPVYRDKKNKSSTENKTLGKSFFWSPSDDELEKIHTEWLMYQQEVKAGKARIVKVTPYGKSIKRITGLSKESDTEIIHMRTKGRDSSDVDITHLGDVLPKHAFFLNKSFLYKLILQSLHEA